MESKITKPDLCFIIGRGRSGTSLLKLMFNAHPDLVVAPEGLFLMNLYKRYAHVTSWSQRQLCSFYDDLWFETRLEPGWRPDKAALKQAILACKETTTFADLCKIVYLHYAASQGKADALILWDKNPGYTLFLRELTNLYPASKFVCLVRDYRDNIQSYQHVGFDVNNTSALAYRWKKYNEEILKYSKKYPNQFTILKYEALVQDAESCLKSLCAFLQVDYGPEMLEFYNDTRSVPQREWHTNVSKPLDESRVYAWKETMPAAEIVKADYICQHVGTLFGYETNGVAKGLHLQLKTLPGLMLGWILTFLERAIFFLPLRLRSFILNVYRKMTGGRDT